MVKLEDTIGLMCSDDYRDRMKAEYIQLGIRMKKLEKHLDEIEPASGEAQHLRIQRNAMRYYRDALSSRLTDNGIDPVPIDALLEGE